LKISVCFVCLGNICRSPTAEGIMLALVEADGLSERIEVDSAGVESYHVGERADSRSRACARERGVELKSRGRQFKATDFDRFDYVLAMDSDNQDDLLRLARRAKNSGGAEAAEAKIQLLRSHEPGRPRSLDVPDPYYTDPGDSKNGFETVFEICERSCRALLETIVEEHDLAR